MRVACLIAIAACAATPKAPPRTKLATAIAAPHSFDIVTIAVPDEGDAAFTKDRAGGLRIWPRLDGTREPIVVSIADVAVDLALAHDGDGFIGAVIDEVGNIAVLDFDRNGSLLHRTQVGGDIAAIQLAAVGNTILALRSDSSIVQLDVRGHQLRHIAAPPQTRLQWLATRHGHAVAATTNAIFRLDVSRNQWTGTFKLAIEISGPLGLSPNGRRVTAIDAADDHAVLIELAQVPRVHAHDKLYPATRDRTSGFVDNAHAIVPSANERRWFDPPFVTTPKPYGIGFSEFALAVGDGIAIAGESTGLELTTPGGRVRHLGYQLLADDVASNLVSTDELIRVATAGDSAFLRIDDNLRDRGLVTLDPKDRPHDVPTVLDERFHAFVTWAGSSPRLLLTDRTAKTTTLITTQSEFGARSYDPGSRVLGIVSGTTALRFRFDPAGMLTPLPSLAVDKNALLQVTDPTLADGVIAIVFNTREVLRYRDADHPPDRTRASGVFLTDRAGTTYAVVRNHLLLTSAGHTTTIPFPIELAVPPDGNPMAFAPLLTSSHDTRSIAIVGKTEVAVIDKHGATRWTTHLEHEPREARFTQDDKRVLVAVAGGIIALDASTGHPTARACGWRFGLFETPLSTGTLAASPNVCESSSPLQ